MSKALLLGRVARRGLYLALSATLLVFTQTGIVAAVGPTCPTGMSDIDCAALKGGWVDWVPFTGTPCTSDSNSSGTTTLQGTDNIQKAFNYFVSKGLSAAQSAGIVGNLMQESGVNPNAVQPNGVGHGIAQWSAGDRWDGNQTDSVKSFAATKGGNMLDLAIQLDFMWYEMSQVSPWNQSLPALRATSTPQDAAIAFEKTYERSADQPGSPGWQNRIKFANQVMTQYGGGTTPSGSTSCAVQCTSGTSTATSDLSSTRQNAVCIAKQELAAWTPPPPTPRMGFLKYSDGSVNDLWCADFVSWVYKQAGYPFTGGLSGGWRLAAVQAVKDLPNSDHNWHWHAASGYTPKPGDLAIHQNPSTGYSHVNMVIEVTGTTITLIGGDQGPGPYGGPNSASLVSQAVMHGSTDDSTVGYTTPD